MIEAYGGPTVFYNDYFITALSPLGYVREGKNLNYYDDNRLIADSQQFIIDSIKQQVSMLNPGPVAWCLGEGTNFKLFRKLNDRHGFFHEIKALPHPRWVMQYRRKSINDYIQLYLDVLK